MSRRTSVKTIELKEALQQRITGEQYSHGERLPSMAELADELKASYVTVNKAVKQLEKEGYIECRHGVGNFVVYRNLPVKPGKKIVNLIAPAIIHDLVRIFQEQGKEIFESAGWEVRICGIAGDISEARDVISDPDTYSVIYGFRPYWENFTACMEHVMNRVVLIGERSDPEGVTCITSDEPQSVRLIMEHLVSQGIDRIAMICANLRSRLESQRAAAWRSLCLENEMSFSWCRDYCFDLSLPAMAPTQKYVKKIWAQLKKQGIPDAVIAPDAEVAAQLIGMAMDDGVKVPENLAVACIGSSELAELFRPQITCIDPNFRGHISTALAILESRAGGYDDNAVFHLCQPKLIVGSSTQKNIKNKQANRKKVEVESI